MQGDDIDYELLRRIEELGSTNQRDLAARMGISVGKVNFCLRAVIEKGWVKVNNFKRADNKWAYAYLLTPSGVSAKVSLAKSVSGAQRGGVRGLATDDRSDAP